MQKGVMMSEHYRTTKNAETVITIT